MSNTVPDALAHTSDFTFKWALCMLTYSIFIAL